MKTGARHRCGQGVKRSVEGHFIIPKNWPDFLSVDENKKELFAYEASQITSTGYISDTKLLISTYNKDVLSSKEIYKTGFAPCSH